MTTYRMSGRKSMKAQSRLIVLPTLINLMFKSESRKGFHGQGFPFKHCCGSLDQRHMHRAMHSDFKHIKILLVRFAHPRAGLHPHTLIAFVFSLGRSNYPSCYSRLCYFILCLPLLRQQHHCQVKWCQDCHRRSHGCPSLRRNTYLVIG